MQRELDISAPEYQFPSADGKDGALPEFEERAAAGFPMRGGIDSTPENLGRLNTKPLDPAGSEEKRASPNGRRSDQGGAASRE